MEEYKEIKGYEGLYWISNLGNVKSKYRVKKPSIDKDGYYIVNLSKEGKSKSFYLHRLLAIHFIPNPNNYPQVNHIDEDKLNNNLDNLQWCTLEQNHNFGTRNKRTGETQRNSISKSKPVLQFDLDNNLISEYPSINEVQRQLGFFQNNIVKCCKGKSKQAYGFIWKYK